MNTLIITALGCMFPFLMTICGSAAVFFFRREMKPVFEQIFLGFAAGVMLAASVWSLLNPAIDAAQKLGIPGWLPAAVGLSMGVLFLLLSDIAVMRLTANKNQAAAMIGAETGKSSGTASQRHRTFLLQLAMTLHNIPEGMAVGLSFALAAQSIAAADSTNFMTVCGITVDSNAFYAAIALSLGIGIQNFPEGAAVSLPLRQDGMSASKAFLRGCLSGVVEPIFGMLTVAMLGSISGVMPWLLSFAAGAMLYVVAEELVPAANAGNGGNGASFVGTISIMAGFLIMMVLDVALG
ncbi:MAG: ZIP family metal transporter [Clostridia bacterium]|nr:ZIP family metal transporter [Clostridia bacterium]